MSDVFAEARVRIRPDTTGFKQELDRDLSTALATTTRSTQGLRTATVGAADAQRNLQKASAGSKAALLGLGSQTSQLNAAMLGLRTAVGSTAVIGLGAGALAAIAFGQALRASITSAAAFEQELNTFQAVTGASADQMKAVSQAAQQLGADITLPSVSAADAAIAMTELSKAGLSVQDSLAGVRGVLQLATAAQIDNAAAAQLAANTLNSFGLGGDQAVRVADDLANAANAAQGSISDFGLALRQSSAVARQVGLSLEDTTAILSLFAKNGLQGSDAGTSLRVALIRLVAPTTKAAAEIQKLGLNIRDAAGNVRADIFAQFGEATRDLAPAARDAAAALIFGQDAIRAVSIGSREGAQGLRVMQAQIDQQGTAAEVAAARTKGLAGEFQALQSNVQTLGITFGSFISIGLTPLLAVVNDLIGDLNTLTEKLKGLGKVKIPPIHIPISIDFPGSGGVPGVDIAASIAQKLEGAIPVAGPALQFAGLVEDLKDLAVGGDKSKERIAALNFEIQKLQDARISAEQGGQPQLADQIKRQIDTLREEVKRLKAEGAGISDAVTAPLLDTIETLKAARAAASSQGQETLVAQLTREISALKVQIPIIQQTEGNLQRLRDDVGDLGTKSSTAAGGVDALTKALAGLKSQSAATDAALLKLQSEGGTPQQQVGVLQSDIATQRQIIEDQQKLGGAPGSATAIKKAREKIISDQSQIESLQAGVVSDQKAAAASAKTAAKDAQTARDEQFQAIADMFGGRQQNIEDAISRAGIAGNLNKEIRLNKALIASLFKERKVLLARLKSLKVGAAVRKTIMDAINAAIESAQQAGLKFTEEQKKNTEDRKEAVRDATQAHLDSVLAIAETTDRKSDDVKAQKARIAFDKAQIARINDIKKKRKLTLDEKAQIDAYKVDIAQRTKALGELKDEVDDSAKKFQELTFAFLQTQQGFASNLLGNLIPGSATGGLVGGAPAATMGLQTSLASAASPLASVRKDSPGGNVRPVSAHQGNTQIDWLRRIWDELRNGNRKAEAPEAHRQRRIGKAAGDHGGVSYQGTHGG